MKKTDIIIVFAALLAAAGIFVFLGPLSGARDAGRVEVYSGGELIRTLELRAAPYEAVIETEEGVNTLLVEPDGARVLSADCHSQVCVRTGKITSPGQVIACLPHRLIIKLAGDAGRNGVDAVAR